MAIGLHASDTKIELCGQKADGQKHHSKKGIPMGKKRVFIASSGDALHIARAIQQNLAKDAFCKVWDQGSFGISAYPLEALLTVVSESDFGVFVFSPSDTARIKKEKYAAVRDNVIFETGLFMGKYGRNRCFIVAPRDMKNLRIPTDLLGVTVATYDEQELVEDELAALGSACNEIRRAIAATKTE